MPPIIRAAGGIVWRGPHRSPQIAVIHRPRRDDWSLPKGKLRHGERPISGAHREVVEETGLSVAVQQQLATVRYYVDGVPKTVCYWAMHHVDGDFTPNDEADKLLWLSAQDAIENLTFPADHDVVRRFHEHPAPDTTILLVRHAKAGKRVAWKKDDTIRPIDAHGRRQAVALAELAALFVPTEVFAATPLRCRQTVQPLADRLGIRISNAPVFSDKDFERRPSSTLRALRGLSRSKSVAVVSSQGHAIPGMLDAVERDNAPHESRKGSVWVLFFGRGELLQADYYECP